MRKQLPSAGHFNSATARIIFCRQRGKQASKTPDEWLGRQNVFHFIQLPLYLHDDFGCFLQLHVFSRPQGFVGRVNFNVGRYPRSFKRTSAPS